MAFGTQNQIPTFFLANIIVKLMAPEFQNTLTLTHYIISYVRICCLKLDNAVSLLPKKLFFCRFLTQNHFCHENRKLQ